MHKYVEYLEKIAGDREKEKELVEIISEALERIKKHCPDEFYGAMYKIHCLICGPHFDDRLAEKAVSHMKNVDGTHGEHWSMEQTNSLAAKHDIKEKADFYYVMNMMHSDYADVLGSDVGTYVKMAKAYMEDPDAADGKVFCTWLGQMRRKDG